jgi:hypothetical protein
MEWSHGPHTQVHEGMYAIKVSMRLEDDGASNLYRGGAGTDQLGFVLVSVRVILFLVGLPSSEL